ncbi:hypothetical protein [Lysinibacter cavernae]|uniref:hypothetical protein n=1 Tax=Lysinibacter cavernae TaxID=1640652 RepID=UPI0036195BB8
MDIETSAGASEFTYAFVQVLIVVISLVLMIVLAIMIRRKWADVRFLYTQPSDQAIRVRDAWLQRRTQLVERVSQAEREGAGNEPTRGRANKRSFWSLTDRGTPPSQEIHELDSAFLRTTHAAEVAFQLYRFRKTSKVVWWAAHIITIAIVPTIAIGLSTLARTELSSSQEKARQTHKLYAQIIEDYNLHPDTDIGRFVTPSADKNNGVDQIASTGSVIQINPCTSSESVVQVSLFIIDGEGALVDKATGDELSTCTMPAPEH